MNQVVLLEGVYFIALVPSGIDKLLFQKLYHLRMYCMPGAYFNASIKLGPKTHRQTAYSSWQQAWSGRLAALGAVAWLTHGRSMGFPACEIVVYSSTTL